jgi:phosphatidylinositol alpha-1,6-mannosyltransferase
MTDDGSGGERFARAMGIPQEKIRVWANGIDKAWNPSPERARALRRALGLSGEDFVLMCLSRLDATKRQDRVLRALPIIRKEVPSARLVLVGEGPMREPLNALGQQLGINQHVIFAGAVPHAQVKEMLGIADVFLQTNDFACVGNTLLEALICHRPIITWDVGTTGAVIKDGYNGLLLPNAEPETLAASAVSLFKSPARRAELSRNAAAYVNEQLQTWEQRLDMEIDLVERMHEKQSRA